MRAFTLIVLMMLVAVPVAGLLLFVRPPTGQLGEVDAVVALAGGTGERLRAAQRTMDEGAAPVLVLSYGPSQLCEGDHPFEVVCFVPEPSTTRGEAQEVGRLVEVHGWDRIAVVTSTQHVPRARMLVGQCADAEVTMVDAGSAFPTNRERMRAIFHEVTGLVATFIDPAC
jgi:uncharacterized SAM-binding protein YcdF (DUF218 family)